jgi:CelD/BcsL family acetyltransferase involved in cellulose biosynthesis
MVEALQVRVYTHFDTLGCLLPAWEELLSEFPNASVFCTPEWLGPWWRAFGAGLEPRIIGFFDTTQRLVALAPLTLSTVDALGGLKLRVLRLMGDGSGDSDNLDLPVRSGYEEAFVRGFLDWLDAHAQLWDICELNTLPANSPAGNRLQDYLKRWNWDTFHSQRPRSVVPLPHSWESYLGQLSTEDRHNLVRYQRRLERRYRVRIYKCTKETQLSAGLEALFRLHQERWKVRGEPGTFCSEARRRFYGEMSRLLLARERLEFWFLDLDGETVAAQFALRYGDAVFQLQEGFDPKHRSDKIGYLLRGHVLKQLVGEGVRCYDFLGGQSPHKARWGSQVGNYMNVCLARRNSLGALYARGEHHLSEGKELLRAHLPRRAWRMLHWANLRLNPEPTLGVSKRFTSRVSSRL